MSVENFGKPVSKGGLGATLKVEAASRRLNGGSGVSPLIAPKVGFVESSSGTPRFPLRHSVPRKSHAGVAKKAAKFGHGQSAATGFPPTILSERNRMNLPDAAVESDSTGAEFHTETSTSEIDLHNHVR